MRALPLSIASLTLAGCANPEALAVSAGLRAVDLPPNVSRLGDVEVVDADALDTGLVCERFVPTGSRIAQQRCFTREESEAEAAVREMILHSEMEEMRRQQQEMARQRALSRPPGQGGL